MTPHTLLAPAPGYILISAVPKAEKTSGGLYIPNAKNQESPVFYVQAVGAQTANQGPTANVGDVILLVSSSGQFVKLGDFDGWLVEFSDVCAVVKENEEYLARLEPKADDEQS